MIIRPYATKESDSELSDSEDDDELDKPLLELLQPVTSSIKNTHIINKRSKSIYQIHRNKTHINKKKKQNKNNLVIEYEYKNSMKNRRKKLKELNEKKELNELQSYNRNNNKNNNDEIINEKDDLILNIPINNNKQIIKDIPKIYSGRSLINRDIFNWKLEKIILFKLPNKIKPFQYHLSLSNECYSIMNDRI